MKLSAKPKKSSKKKEIFKEEMNTDEGRMQAIAIIKYLYENGEIFNLSPETCMVYLNQLHYLKINHRVNGMYGPIEALKDKARQRRYKERANMITIDKVMYDMFRDGKLTRRFDNNLLEYKYKGCRNNN